MGVGDVGGTKCSAHYSGRGGGGDDKQRRKQT